MELDFRKQRILQAIVQDYVLTAEPVGSQVLVERYGLGVKSATIRSEMAAMSESGYLRQPHTSAGRVPSDQGYRFYVNRLMQLPVIPHGEATVMQSAVRTASSELEAILRRTCQLLAQMTRLPAVATPPEGSQTELRQVFVAPAGADKTLLVLLFSTGHTENRVLSLRLSASDALLLANGLNERWGGAALPFLTALPPEEIAHDPPAELSHLSRAWRHLHDEIAQAARALREETPVVVEGTHVVLQHPEFNDIERLGNFLTVLQERAALLEMLQRTLEERRGLAPEATIGQESGQDLLRDYAFVGSVYSVGGRERGTIGVFGPTRMDYGRVFASVEFMARTISDILTRLSVAP